MESFTDEEIMALMNAHYQSAKTMPKEGKGTRRNAGDCGRGSNNWIMLRREARLRGLVS